MKLFLGTDGLNKFEIKNDEVYFLEMGTFIVFNEIFSEEIKEKIYYLKGNYDLILNRNYEILSNSINNEKKNILHDLRKASKYKIEKAVTLLISENVFFQKFNFIIKKLFFSLLILLVDFTKFNN